MSKAAVRHIADTLGAEAIQSQLGVTHRALRHARSIGYFPAAWFAGLEAMCLAAGIDCPRSAFSFKVAENMPADVERADPVGNSRSVA
jgi:hypothetical protein